MSGARVELEFDNSQVLAAVRGALDELADHRPLLLDIGEALVNSTRDRFNGAVSAQAGAAELAAATAALTSCTEARDTLAVAAPVAGLKTSWLRPLSEREIWPLMK